MPRLRGVLQHRGVTNPYREYQRRISSACWPTRLGFMQTAPVRLGLASLLAGKSIANVIGSGVETGLHRLDIYSVARLIGARARAMHK